MECLKDLPCFNRDNFSKLENGAPKAISTSSLVKRKLHLSSVEHPKEQLIVNEKCSILLRYLHKQWNKKEKIITKRDHCLASEQVDAVPSTSQNSLSSKSDEPPPAKVPRLS